MAELHEYYKRKGYCTSPLGFPCKDEMAFEIDSLLKEAEKNGFGYKRHFALQEATEDLEPGSRTEISVITTNDVDRDNEVVDVRGLHVGAFKKNPVVAFGHDYSIPPVGRAQWLKALPTPETARLMKAKIEYVPEGLFQLADDTFNLVKTGFLLGKSIGFIAREMGPVTQKEIDERPELAGVKNVIRKSALLEISVASIPSNPNALREQVAKGIIRVPDYFRKHLGLTFTDEDEYLMKCAECWNWDDGFLKPTYSRNWTQIINKLDRTLSR